MLTYGRDSSLSMSMVAATRSTVNGRARLPGCNGPAEVERTLQTIPDGTTLSVSRSLARHTACWSRAGEAWMTAVYPSTLSGDGAPRLPRTVSGHRPW